MGSSQPDSYFRLLIDVIIFHKWGVQVLNLKRNKFILSRQPSVNRLYKLTLSRVRVALFLRLSTWIHSRFCIVFLSSFFYAASCVHRPQWIERHPCCFGITWVFGSNVSCDIMGYRLIQCKSMVFIVLKSTQLYSVWLFDTLENGPVW